MFVYNHRLLHCSGEIQLVTLPTNTASVELNVSVSDQVHMSFSTVYINIVCGDIKAPVFLADNYEVWCCCPPPPPLFYNYYINFIYLKCATEYLTSTNT